MAKSSSSSAFVSTSSVMPLAALVLVLLSLTISTANAEVVIVNPYDEEGLIAPVVVGVGDRLSIQTADKYIEEIHEGQSKRYTAVDRFVLTDPLEVGNYLYYSPDAGPFFEALVLSYGVIVFPK